MIGIVGSALVMATVVSIHKLSRPDAKWRKEYRKSTIRWDIVDD